MITDLPACDFVYCLFQLDGNCRAGESRRAACKYAKLPDEPADTPTSPWHRVEEPPNFSGKVLVWRDVLGDFGDREYTFDTAYYNGLDGAQIPKGTFFQPIPGKMVFRVLDDVTHWARPKPPKEGNNGSSRKEASSDL